MAAVSAISFQVIQIGGAQNSAICVCWGVRVVLVTEPRLRTSANAALYALLVRGDGGMGRNWLALWIAKGCTCAQCVKTGCPNLGGVGR
jgi:hypothetical protein